jgi:hypothetical protein
MSMETSWRACRSLGQSTEGRYFRRIASALASSRPMMPARITQPSAAVRSRLRWRGSRSACANFSSALAWHSTLVSMLSRLSDLSQFGEPPQSCLCSFAQVTDSSSKLRRPAAKADRAAWLMSRCHSRCDRPDSAPGSIRAARTTRSSLASGKSAASTRPAAARQSALVLVDERQRPDDALWSRGDPGRG